MNSRSYLWSLGRVPVGQLLQVACIGVALQAAACSSDGDGASTSGDSGDTAGSAGSGGGDDFGGFAVGAGGGGSSVVPLSPPCPSPPLRVPEPPRAGRPG
ncbi:hypothetical protein [Sorangium sp. So ce1182]|uniref:hypothetical protein n=1 Tax=Sorangium sp. So ce1182 TaxID=3133334 RepID=UPI003F605A4C